jgi:hypothetical protein
MLLQKPNPDDRMTDDCYIYSVSRTATTTTTTATTSCT